MTSEPGAKFDAGKLRLSLLIDGLNEPLTRVAEVLEYGANKYCEEGWMSVPNAKRRYQDALYRHLFKFHAGEVLDPESGLPHLSHAACNLLFLLHFYKDELDGTQG